MWDTTSVPNGTYVVKVVASDTPSNPPGSALEGELESAAFDIDNTPPVITFGTSRVDQGRTTIRFDVRGRLVGYPEGGVFARRAALAGGLSEGRDLRFAHGAVRADARQQRGDQRLIIRAYDAKNNSATARGDVDPRTARKAAYERAPSIAPDL